MGVKKMVTNTDIFGRKVFFVAPDDALVPHSFMEDFCTLGYETHIIQNGMKMRSDVVTIAREFPDAILFFNAEAAPGGSSSGWTALINDIRRERDNLLVGIIFREDAGAKQVESRYGREISAEIGCIPLSSDLEKNFQIIKTVLEKSGAKGRRNNIRAACDGSSRAEFSFNGLKKSVKLVDVNISHICCSTDTDDFGDIRIYDKIRGAVININGMEIKSDMVMIMKRKKEFLSTAIFMFIREPDDEPGLKTDFEPQLNRKIYQITAQKLNELLRK